MFTNSALQCIQNSARLRVQHYRELADRFRWMAEQEFSPAARRRLQLLAVEYQEIAEDLSTATCGV